MGLERVKAQEKRREQENHNVGRGPTYDRKGLMIKKSVGNRKIIMSDEIRHMIGKG
jgi:hypothetical protein